jgi:hypothetical protein
MKKRLMTAVLSVGMFVGTTAPNAAQAATYYHARAHNYRHRRHMRTLRRVGIGAAGGAAIGAIAAGGKGAGIGAIAGAGAGYLYDRHERHHHH